MTSLARWLPAAALGALALFYAIKFAQESRGLAAIPWSAFGWPCVAVAALSIGNYLLRFARWHGMLVLTGHRPSLGRSLLAYFAGFALTVSPGKAGELIRARYYRALGVPPSAVGAGFIVERLLDVVAVALLCLLAIELLMSMMSLASLLAVSGLFVGIGAAVLVIVGRWLRARPLDASASSTWLGRARSVAVRSLQGCAALLVPRVALPALAIGVLAWGLEGIGLWLLVEAAQPGAMAWMPAVALYCASLLAGAFSFVPGGLGGTEAVLLLGLDRAGMGIDLAVAVTLICRLLTLWLAVALGWAAALFLGWRRDDGTSS
jgi:uncharacterized protein (TIRG00374 family)